MVKLLLAHGANVNASGGHYGTALQTAADWGRLEIVTMLLEHGADVNIVCGEYGTALHAAKMGASRSWFSEEEKRRCKDIVALLLRHGASTELADLHT